MEAKTVVKNLISLYRDHKLGHAYLIETNNISKCYEDVKKIVKGISCNENYCENCEKCSLCHLIDENNLPSLITVEPDGKNIKKESIENLKNAFSKIPLYTKNNIYIIKSPEKMNDTAFNKMLKFLEEPEANIIGFFITENKDNVANTIISRCELQKMIYDDNTESEVLGIEQNIYDNLYFLAQEYVKMIDSNDKNLVWYNNSVLSKELADRSEITVFFKIIFNLYLNKLESNNIDRDIIFKHIKIINKYLTELNYNVNTALLLDSFVLEIGEVYGK